MAPWPPLPQELNGRPLSEERKIVQKVKFARIAQDWQLNMKVVGSLEWPGVLEKQSLWCFVEQFVELIVTDFKVET